MEIVQLGRSGPCMARIAELAPASGVAGTRYDPRMMAHLDREKK